MKDILWKSDKAYTVLRRYVDSTTRRMFSTLKMEGLENIPSEGAVLIAPNHCNTLMDALVVLQSRWDATAFGARADIFRKPKIAAILNWLRIVPLARKRDAEEMRAGNKETFGEVVECINRGVPFGIYVEGTHFPGYTVHQVHPGVFKIAALSLERYPDTPVWIVPAGISYSDFYDAGNSVVLRYGAPLDAREVLKMAPYERTELLQTRIQDLVREPGKKRHSPLLWALALLCLPLFVLAAVLGLPLWLTSEIICGKMKDHAWNNTVRFGVCLLLRPVLAILAAAPLFIFLPWQMAAAALLAYWVSEPFFYKYIYNVKRLASRG